MGYHHESRLPHDLIMHLPRPFTLCQHSPHVVLFPIESPVYLFASNKDAVWKLLILEVPHNARMRLSAKQFVHTCYQRSFVPELNSWPC